MFSHAAPSSVALCAGNNPTSTSWPTFAVFRSSIRHRNGATLMHRRPQVQSSANTPIIIYLYPAKSLIFYGKVALANLLV
jgi:hypothetical protein